MEVQKQIGSQVDASIPQLQIAGDNYSHTREQISVNNSNGRITITQLRKTKATSKDRLMGNFKAPIQNLLTFSRVPLMHHDEHT